MNVVVTGGKGFIGKNLLKKLVSMYDDINILQFTRNSPIHTILFADVIFHLAANPLVSDDSDHDDNLRFTQKLCDAIDWSYNPHFIFTSSATVYGDDALARGASINDTPNPKSQYGKSKLQCEELIRKYTGKYSIIRMVANTGKYSTHGVVHDIINKLKSKDPTIELFGDSPGSHKQFVNVIDTANFLYSLIDNPAYGIFNLCPEKLDLLSVFDIYGLAMEILGIYKPAIWRKNAVWSGDNSVVMLRNNLIDYELKYKTSVEAVKKTLVDAK